MSTPPDIPLMRRAMDLAMRGRGHVEPNPMVGCVIARDGHAIAEGWHHAFGLPHAEADALARCEAAGISPRGASAHVTLEPCCHVHKKTPPCVPKLIAAGIRRVVVGAVDPNPQVAGRGLDQLRQAGIIVERSPLEAECLQLLAPFTALVKHHRPYVTLKWAQTADGKVAGPGGKRLQISNEISMRQVHILRSRSDAILIGIQTALNDDPLLTPRGVPEGRHPIRIVLDTYLRLGEQSRLAATANDVTTWVYCSPEAAANEHAKRLADCGILIKPSKADSGMIDLNHVLHDLADAGVTHLLVEPGPTLAQSFIRQNLADRAWIFDALMRVDDPAAPAAPTMPWPATEQIMLGTDRLREHLNPASEVYFHPDPSADLRLALKAILS